MISENHDRWQLYIVFHSYYISGFHSKSNLGIQNDPNYILSIIFSLSFFVLVIDNSQYGIVEIVVCLIKSEFSCCEAGIQSLISIPTKSYSYIKFY